MSQPCPPHPRLSCSRDARACDARLSTRPHAPPHSSPQAHLDPDRELRLTGLVTLLVGGTGGLIGSHSPGLVALNQEVGSARTSGVCQALLLLLLWPSHPLPGRAGCGALLTPLSLYNRLTAFPLTNLLPRFLLGGVLMSIGDTQPRAGREE